MTSSQARPDYEPTADDALLARHAEIFAHPEEGELVVSPPGGGLGSWAGAPSAVFVDGTFVLAYRLRRPIGHGRGFANVIARSQDGVTFSTAVVLEKDIFGADSIERPALARTEDGRWRVYVSPNTPDTDHWRVDLLESATLEGLATARPETVLAGSSSLAVKDPVVLFADDRWHLWASCHPLTDAAHTDRMTTEYATSADGVEWSWEGTALAGRPGHWDARGVRFAAVVIDGSTALAYYDGRATAEENWEERTGIAVSRNGLESFRAIGDAPVGQSRFAAHGLRYVSVVALEDGSSRYYYELTRADGAHEIRTRARPCFALSTTPTARFHTATPTAAGVLMALPHFFIIGAPKSGTTALHVALAAHPELFLSRVKEPKYFLTDGPPPTGGGPGDAKTFREHIWQRGDYEALFDAAPSGTLRGESTSLYLYDDKALERIHAAIPDAKLIALLRDPVDRAHSNWAHLWSAGLEPEKDFVTACKLEDQRAAAGWAQFWRYLDLGRYGSQLERLLGIFPREQVLLIRYRELREEPIATLDRICDFLGVETGVLTGVPAENVTAHATDSLRNRSVATLVRTLATVEHRLPHAWWPRIEAFLGRHLQSEQRTRQPLTPDERAALVPHFTDDVRLLEKLTGEDFGAWLDPNGLGRRATLAPTRPIGTAHNSIDNPLKHLDEAR